MGIVRYRVKNLATTRMQINIWPIAGWRSCWRSRRPPPRVTCLAARVTSPASGCAKSAALSLARMLHGASQRIWRGPAAPPFVSLARCCRSRASRYATASHRHSGGPARSPRCTIEQHNEMAANRDTTSTQRAVLTPKESPPQHESQATLLQRRNNGRRTLWTIVFPVPHR